MHEAHDSKKSVGSSAQWAPVFARGAAAVYNQLCAERQHWTLVAFTNGERLCKTHDRSAYEAAFSRDPRKYVALAAGVWPCRRLKASSTEAHEK